MKTIVINTAHLKELLEESSLAQLDSQTRNSFGPDREAHSRTINVANMLISPAENSLQVSADVVNTNGSSSYQSNMLFQDVDYLEEGQPGVTFTGSDGEQYTIEPLERGQSQVQVGCTCMDFYWTFATWNDNDGSLLGAPPQPYVKKPDSNRPPRNPNQTPGLCKHLYAVGQELQNQGLLR
jgi:hypothetical protein